MQFSRRDASRRLAEATLAGRLLLDDGPTPVLIRDGAVEDVSRAAPTIADLMDLADPASVAGDAAVRHRRARAPCRADRFLAPVDLQAVKAAGVTFAISAIERVIEERARGDFRRARPKSATSSSSASAARSVRSCPEATAAAALKDALIEDGLWSQYLEVAIGPDAEIFTKTAPLASVGWGAEIGVRSDSSWNNPEPEVVLVVEQPRRNSRRDARQRRQPARLRGAQRAAAEQGQGQ